MDRRRGYPFRILRHPRQMPSGPSVTEYKKALAANLSGFKFIAPAPFAITDRTIRPDKKLRTRKDEHHCMFSDGDGVYVADDAEGNSSRAFSASRSTES